MDSCNNGTRGAMTEPDCNDVTLGEVYRLVLATNANVNDLRDELKSESHSLRNKIASADVKSGLFDLRLSTVENANKDRQGWIAGAVSGGVIAAFAAWLQSKLGVQ